MIKLEGVYKNFGNLKVLEDFSLEIPEGKITAVLGPSGCGKTTLLNILAGLIKVDRGSVFTEENVSYLFQEPRLVPWLTIRQNIVLVLHNKISRPEINQSIETELTNMGLTKYADYYPVQLSGGMRQRAAMARALVYNAPLLLMDEPFKSLDIRNRFQLSHDFLNLIHNKPQTAVIVTHDVKEAIILGDKIVVLSEKPSAVLECFELGPNKSGITETELIKFEHKILQLLLK